MSESKAKQDRAAKKQCDTCAFYQEDNSTQGRCTRYPPTAILVPGPNGGVAQGGVFSPTTGTNVCGEWQQGNMIKPVHNLPVNLQN